MRMFFAALLVVLAAPGAGCRGDRSVDDCQRMADHVVALQLEPLERRAAADPEIADRVRAHRESLIAANAATVEQCRRSPDKAFLHCALGAESTKQLAGCHDSLRSER